MSVNQEAVRDTLPDIIFYMDIDVDTAFARTFDAVGDKWEKMGKDFFEKIVHGYEKCEKLEILKNRFYMIDARGSQQEVFERILDIIQ